MKELYDKITMNELSQIFSDDILSPFSDQKAINDLTELPDASADFLFDPSVSLFNFQDDALMNDYLFSLGTAFGCVDKHADENSSPSSTHMRKDSSLSKDIDTFLGENANNNMCTHAYSHLYLDDTCTLTKKEISNNHLPDFSASSSDELNLLYLGFNNVCPNGVDTSFDSRSSSCSSECSSGYGSEWSAAEDKDSDMVVLGVDISNLLHDYAMKLPPVDPSCVVPAESQFVSRNNSTKKPPSYSMPNPSCDQSCSYAASVSPCSLQTCERRIVVSSSKSLLRKSNLSGSTSKLNSRRKLPPGAGHRMTVTGIDPMLSTYPVQGSPLSSSGSSRSLQCLATYTSSRSSSSSSTASARTSCPASSSSSTASARTSGAEMKPEERVYTCTFKDCKKVYSKGSHLKAHVRRHTGEKPFHCSWPDCDWKFSRSDELARHKRSHSGVKPYKCDVCIKCFSRSDHLAKHKKVHRKNK